MRPVINNLVQLQELMIARAQQVAVPGAEISADLDQSIKSLSAKLPEDVRFLFERIQKKDLLAIVPVSHGACTGCGMTVSVSGVQAVKHAETLQTCRHCARILYFPVLTVRGLGSKPKRGETPKVGIERFSSPALMIPDLKGETAEDVLKEMSQRMKDEGFVEDAETLAQQAIAREGIFSTAMDHGIAFPHVRGVEGGGLTLVLGCHRKGIKFGAPGKKLTRIFFFMAIPTASSAFYLKLLSGLSSSFAEAESRDKLLEAQNPEVLWKALVRLTRLKVI